MASVSAAETLAPGNANVAFASAGWFTITLSAVVRPVTVKVCSATAAATEAGVSVGV
jgi:hypothetical protein